MKAIIIIMYLTSAQRLEHIEVEQDRCPTQAEAIEITKMFIQRVPGVEGARVLCIPPQGTDA